MFLKKIITHTRDFGLFDRVEHLVVCKKNNRLIGDTQMRMYAGGEEKGGMTWVCFLPWRTSYLVAKKYNLLPRHTKFVAFEGPVTRVDPDPSVAKESLFRLVEEVEKLHLKNFGVLGLSAGNYPAWYVANHFDAQRLVSVCPGSRLGSSIWNGIATREVCRRSIEQHGMSEEVYDSVLEGTNPIENTKNLPGEIDIHIASHDKFIPTHLGEELISHLATNQKQYRLSRYKGKGHFLTLLKFGLTHNL
jgi:hypothetical protein